jgi:hypothetical protein
MADILTVTMARGMAIIVRHVMIMMIVVPSIRIDRKLYRSSLRTPSRRQQFSLYLNLLLPGPRFPFSRYPDPDLNRDRRFMLAAPGQDLVLLPDL